MHDLTAMSCMPPPGSISGYRSRGGECISGKFQEAANTNPRGQCHINTVKPNCQGGGGKSIPGGGGGRGGKAPPALPEINPANTIQWSTINIARVAAILVVVTVQMMS